MKYYIIYVPDEDRYVYTKRVLVRDETGAKKFASPYYAKQVAKSCDPPLKDFRIIGKDTESLI